MCFYNGDCDWYAEVTEKGFRTLDKTRLCDECRRPIAVGAMVHTVYMQEHEDEQCEWCDDGVGCDECDGTGKRGPGETFYYLRCHDCELFLQAVHDAEIKSGCPEGETLPPYEAMIEYIGNAGMDEAKKYWKLAKKKNVDTTYLAWLWRATFNLPKE